MANTLSTTDTTRLAPADGGHSAAGHEAAGTLPVLVLPSRRDHLHDLLPRPHHRLLLLLLHPVGPVHVDVDRPEELSGVLQ